MGVHLFESFDFKFFVNKRRRNKLIEKKSLPRQDLFTMIWTYRSKF